MRLNPAPTGAPRRTFNPAPSPITRTELEGHQLGRELRQAILDEITRFVVVDAPAGATTAAWAARIWLSAAAYGAALGRDFLEHLCAGLADSIFTDEGEVWLEYELPAGLRRWIADVVTGLLLLDFKQRHSAFETEVPVREVERELASVLRQLQPLTLLATRDALRKSLLVDALTAYHRRFLPGVLLAHATGHTQSAAVSRSCLVRAAGARLALQETPCPVSETPGSLLDSPSPYIAPALAVTDTAMFKPLKSALAQFQPSSKKGGKASGFKGERRVGLDVAIQALELADPLSHTIQGMVRGWVRTIIKHGPQKEQLETSTILEYTQIVVRFAQTKTGQNVLEADVEEVEVVLRNVIEAGGVSGIKKRVRALRHFHNFLVTRFHAEEVEWAAILVDLPDVIGHVDANVLFWHEVLLADQLIQEAVLLPQPIRLCARLALHLMWATGMRFGEAYRSRVMDFSEDLSFAYICPTEHGNTKSVKGIRFVPLLLKDKGREVLNEALAQTRLFAHGDHLAPLMGDPADPRALLPRRQISALLGEALREAAGDPRVRAHHLRHGYATRVHDCGLGSCDRIDGLADSESVQLTLVGQTGPTRRFLHSLAQVLGQASPDVSTKVYVHHTEFRIQKLLVGELPSLGVRQLAALTGRPTSWVYRNQHLSSASLLRQALVFRTQQLPLLDYRVGVPTTLLPVRPIGALAATMCRGRLPLLELDALLRLALSAGLPASIVASLASTTNIATSAFIASAIAIANKLGYRRLARFESSQWAGAGRKYEGVGRRAARFEDLPMLPTIDALHATPSLMHAAATILRKHVRDSRKFSAVDVEELDAIARWLAAIKLRSHDISVQCPSTGGDVSPSVRHACRALGAAQFTTKPLLKRGASVVDVCLLENPEWTVPSLIHATYLWLVRAESESATAAASDQSRTLEQTQ